MLTQHSLTKKKRVEKEEKEIIKVTCICQSDLSLDKPEFLTVDWFHLIHNSRFNFQYSSLKTMKR